ncbi:MAG: alpha/beta hydrolase [Actinobacteria bacterium]|nr:MAG: alpha/beta hydrolase [Actinomycetota bacterium]
MGRAERGRAQEHAGGEGRVVGRRRHVRSGPSALASWSPSITRGGSRCRGAAGGRRGDVTDRPSALGNLADDGKRARCHLEWARTTVSGRPACYGVAGTGRPVVFLHGWALGQHAYKRALKRIVNLGYRVYAPALPGFGGTADLPPESVSFAGYAEWLHDWLAALSVDQPVSLVGHSFGGGVAIELAHDHPERVSSLVLVDAVGHPTGRRMWEWGVPRPPRHPGGRPAQRRPQPVGPLAGGTARPQLRPVVGAGGHQTPAPARHRHLGGG